MDAQQLWDQAALHDEAIGVQDLKKRTNLSVMNLINTYVHNLRDLGLGDFRNVKKALASRVCIDSSGNPVMVKSIFLHVSFKVC
jgi:hypothetical protein